MGNFKAHLELPRFNSKDEILGKEVFDSDLLYIGAVKDWTYSSDGTIKLVLKNDEKRISILISFYYIEKVGAFIELKVKRVQFIKDLGDIKEPVEAEARKKLIDTIAKT